MTTPAPDLNVELRVPDGPWTGPIPVPDLDSAAFWEGLRLHRMVIMRCDECAYWIHPPIAGCPRCQSLALTAVEVCGQGTIYSFTLVNREFAPGIAPPYVAAYVDLDEQPSLRVLTNIVNARLSEIEIGMPVRAVYHDIGDSTLLYFEPAGER